MTNILVVDDSGDIAQLMALILQKHDYNVDIAENGKIAFEMIEKDPAYYSLVLTDLLMPVLDGPGLVRKIKGAGYNIKMLAMSGGGVTLSATEALKAVEPFVFAVLPKPVDRDALIEKVQQALASN